MWEQYVRESGAHPLAARFGLAEAFARYLETAPTLRLVKGGARGEKALAGPPRSDAARANVLSAYSSFHTYAVRAAKAFGLEASTQTRSPWCHAPRSTRTTPTPRS